MRAKLTPDRYLAAAAGLFALAVILPFLTTRPLTFAFEFELQASKPGVVQLFYDVGRGYNQADSSYLPIEVGVMKTYRLPLPRAHYTALRFDPTTGDGTIILASPRIVNGWGHAVHRYPLEHFRPLQEIGKSEIRSGKLRLDMVPGATDPVTLIDGVKPFSLYYSLTGSLSTFLPRVLWPAMAALLAAWAAAAGTGEAILAWSGRRPRLAVAIAAAAGVCWQMHPVIFGGRSLVSPDNGPVAMLYEGSPTLPGYHPHPNDAHGSDVGALMWQSVPGAAAEYDAVLRDHQLPLWNRFNRCGIPLLGQGQSMFGDPLQLITALSKSAGWAWDARFAIARWLFACGIGIVAWQLEAGLAGALIAALSASFLGFFAFRYNHPAIFSLCYSPWILVAWAALSRAAPRGRGVLAPAGLLILSTLMTMTSGTMKEAYMLIACLHFTGLLLVLFSPRPGRRRRLAVAAAALLILALLAAPLWIGFLVALRHGYTLYDEPGAIQFPLKYMAGFFDDMFYRDLGPAEGQVSPSTNFLVLLGLAWTLAGLRRSARHPAWLAVAAGSLLPFCLVFGIVPAAAIVRIPYLANVIHIFNVFSCVLIVHALVLAAFGWSWFLGDLGSPEWADRWPRYLLILAVVLGIYFANLYWIPKSRFFSGYAPALIIAVAVLPWLARRARAAGRIGAAAAACLGCFALTLWRHGEYVHSPFKFYTVNPGVRVDLRPASPSLNFVRAHGAEPSRTLGLGQNFFPGYGELTGIETLYGVDPIESRDFLKLAEAFKLERVWDYTGVDPESDVAPLLRARDMLNNRYYLATHRSIPAVFPGLRLLRQSDFDIYESQTVWPRAFFTDAVQRCADVEGFAREIASGDGRPFAAIEEPGLMSSGLEGLRPFSASRAIVPASDYQLTGNTTAFTVNASGAGVVVLTEAYFPQDFRARLDGHSVPYFRVNGAFKGIAIPNAGIHRVSFSYWPEYFTAELILSAMGLTLLLGAWAWILCSERKQAVSP